MMAESPVGPMSSPPPAITGVRVSAPVVLAIGVWIELGAPAGVGDDMLSHGRACQGEWDCEGNRGKQDSGSCHLEPRLFPDGLNDDPIQAFLLEHDPEK